MDTAFLSGSPDSEPCQTTDCELSVSQSRLEQKASPGLTRRAALQLAVAAVATTTLNHADAIGGSLDNSARHSAGSSGAKQRYDLSTLKWQLSGCMPYMERLGGAMSISNIQQTTNQKVGPIPASVPGSVQLALLNAGLIKDWNIGFNARDCQWVENEDWVYQTVIPDQWLHSGKQFRLHCEGLDYRGGIFLNGNMVASFEGSFHPWDFDLSLHLKTSGNILEILFQPPPRWLGQLGYTSHMKKWKPRFNYGWDWISRVVQVGIWDAITLEVVEAGEIREFRAVADVDMDSRRGLLKMYGAAVGGSKVRLTLADDTRVVHQEEIEPKLLARNGVQWNDLTIALWWPNGHGEQKLYNISCDLLNEKGQLIDHQMRTVGFRNIQWRKNKGTKNTVNTYLDVVPEADRYLCAVNGKEIFLCGIDWTPIRPNFADLKKEDYDKRLNAYHDMGVKILRVWGGAFLETEYFYNQCDRLGILLWQEFPLSSSSIDCYPPADPDSVETMGQIAESYIKRRQHHPALLLWCGGNELANNLNGINPGKHQEALTIRHPILKRFYEVIEKLDHGRRFLQTSPFGPRLQNNLEECGKGVFWDTHGPWNFNGPVDGYWKDLWDKSDSMFYSELGAPGASSAELIRKYKGDLQVFPCSSVNPLWNRNPWWIDWPKFIQEKGHTPANLEEFVDWSQARQAAALGLAARAALSRFPACGGFMVWMGHDAFPCTANTAVIDFEGNLKPAGVELGKVYRSAL